MNQYRDLPLAQAHHCGGRVIDHPIDHLDLEEMVPRAERPALVGPADDGAIAHAPRISARQPALGLGEGEVAIGPESLLDHVRHTLLHQLDQLGLVENEPPALAHAGGDIAEELVHQGPDLVLDVAPLEVGPEQSDAAVDVVADAPRRDHPALLRVRRGHAANAKAVAPVNIRHGQAGLLDSRQGRHVHDLLGPLVLLDLFDELIVGEDQAIDPHVLAVAHGDLPLARPHLLEGAGVSSALGHGSLPGLRPAGIGRSLFLHHSQTQ